MSRRNFFAKLDERYDDHRKIKRAWRQTRAAVGLHAMAITYCKRHNTDGVVDAEWIEDRLPSAKERERVLTALVELELFDLGPDGSYRVHNYLEYQESATARGARSERARAAADRRWDAKRNANGMQDAYEPHCETDADRIANRNAGRNAEERRGEDISLNRGGGMGGSGCAFSQPGEISDLSDGGGAR